MKKSLYLNYSITLLFCFFSIIVFAQNPLNITNSMVHSNNNSNPELLFDGEDSSFWFSGWDSDNYPAYAYIDLGQPTELSKIDLFDASGEGGFKIYTGSPDNWNVAPIIHDPLTQYLTWNEHPVNITTQYLRLEMLTPISRVGEIKIFGGVGGNSPSWNTIDDIVIHVGDSLSFEVQAFNADSLTSLNLPHFVTFIDNGNGVGTFSILPSEVDTGSYEIVISAIKDGVLISETFLIIIKSDTTTTGTEIRYDVFDILAISDNGDISNLFDEQLISGDPRNGPGGNPTQYWFAGWDNSDYPASGLVDLGEVKQITRIFIRDINGEGSLKIFTGESPSDWNDTPIIEDGLTGYLTWNEHPLNIATQFLKFEIDSPTSNVAEVLIYGTGPSVIDTIPPDTITDLAMISNTYNSISLQWTASGDDGLMGTVEKYDLRYDTLPITEQNFYNADSLIIPRTQLTDTIENITIQGLICNTNYYFAIKAIDEVDNISSISNLTMVATASCPTPDIFITITFDTIPDSIPIINPAKLRFNKDFAYSLSFDDGSPESYNNTFPIMSGGISQNGDIESGGYYTDGCGNEIVFTGAIAINGWHIHEHPSAAYMSWPQVQEMYQADWDILNHSFKHCAYDSCDYDAEVLENTFEVEAELGFTMTHFVVPSGDYEGYRTPAFNNEMVALHDQNWLLPGNGGLQVDAPFNLYQFELHRNSLEFEIPPYQDDIDMIADKSTNGNHYWFSDYGHKVGNPGEPFIGITMDDFRDYMIYLEDTYGRDGSDRIWVAPVQEVYKYILVRDQIIPVSADLNNNQFTVTYSLDNIPDTLRRNSLSLVLDLASNISVSNIEVTGANVTFNSEGLINLSW